MTKLKAAQERNWLKFQIIGSSRIHLVKQGVTTEEETQILSEIEVLRTKLLSNWDESSIKLGMKPRYAYEKKNAKIRR